ncbi:MAG: type VI secretion system baseplate subunit TssK [Spirochaetaceae bacterium]|jgi:type VI secretion system ImpJ/VasE family protein|nr:type VI secretion system baseplate subunit TssK [Spirochaetaceae bacterium]
MRFEELLHWNDGQFLQPHHFQYQQRIASGYARLNRSFFLPYSYGLLDFELDQEALKGGWVSVKRFSAVMEDGLELSMPGNCILKPLDLGGALRQNPAGLTVYAAVPRWSEFEANLAGEDSSQEKKFYMAEKKRVRDENSGDNEITLVTRRINARLVTERDNTNDMQILPILKLTVLTRDVRQSLVEVDEKYIPPFMMLTVDDPLFAMAAALITDIRRCRDKQQDTLTTRLDGVGDFSRGEAFDDARSLFLLRTLNYYDIRLSSLLVDGFITPFALYLELASFLAELMAFNPKNGIREIRRYDHDDRLPVFAELFKDIRSFIRSEGGAGYIKLNFTPVEGEGCLFAAIKTEDIADVDEMYLAVSSGAEAEEVVRALEQGDTFKLINPKSKSLRIRGMKLVGMRYPPRFLPVLDGTLWFRLDLEESAKVWRDMCEEKGMMIDYAPGLFPGLETSLFITIVE